jgi:hypothetical protein
MNPEIFLNQGEPAELSNMNETHPLALLRRGYPEMVSTSYKILTQTGIDTFLQFLQLEAAWRSPHYADFARNDTSTFFGAG